MRPAGLPFVVDRPVLPVLTDGGVTAGRAHGERHQRVPKLAMMMMAFVVVRAWLATLSQPGRRFSTSSIRGIPAAAFR